MRAAVLTFAVMTSFVLGGCANNAYYQTRYAPTSSEESYSSGERLFWQEEHEVYALPSRPPALAANEVGADDDHRQRIDCVMPGPQLKSDRVAVGDGTEIHGHSRVDNLPMVTMRDERNGVPLPSLNGSQVGGWHDERELGASDDRPHLPVSGYDSRPVPVRGEGIDRHQSNIVAGTRDDEGWCPPKR